ncbi:MAG: hypothetical protein GC150_04105 [Rhizobiales bacterium]|nr:hypothetical protein [Hyphomicrobiales bacterium]
MADFEIDYEALAQDALRGIVRRVLAHAAVNGLPGEHHFYISFSTGAPGVSVSKRLRQLYPEDMTIVLQHQFWDLTAEKEHFEVKLSFNGRTEQLVVPYRAIKMFYDPSVPYGLQFEPVGSDSNRQGARGAGDALGAGDEGKTLGEIFAEARASRDQQDDGPRGPRVATSMGEPIASEQNSAITGRGKGRGRDGKNTDDLLGEALDDALDTLRGGSEPGPVGGLPAPDAAGDAAPDDAEDEDKPTATVVSLDAFRKK